MAIIAITSNTSWYLYNFRKNTIKSLIDNGYQVIAVAPADDYSSRLEGLGARFVHVDIDQGGTNPFKDLYTIFAFGQIFVKHKVSLVLNFTPKNNIYSTLAALVCGVKVINNIAGLGVLFVNENYTSKVVRILYKISQRYAHKIFFQNEEDRAFFVENKIARQNVTDCVPGSGVDLSRFSVTRSEDDGVVRFLLVARMLYDKGVVHYVEAARALKDKYGHAVEFRLLGFLDANNPSAITEEQMQSWVDERVIIYLGVSDCVEHEIAKIDCMVLPSFYREGVPKSLLEAGAMGKPIVTTDNVGCRETVDHGVNGYLCEPRSTESLQEALGRMVEMGHRERLLMGLKSRKKIEKEFDERIVIRKYLDAIREVV